MDSRIPDNRRPWFFYFIGYAYATIPYILTNHQTLQQPHLLPLTWMDRAIPFLPWTGWIYATVYLMPLIAAIFVNERREILAMLWAFIISSSVCYAIFLVYPTAYSRPAMEHTGLLTLPLHLFRQVDTPQNCWPSGHVAYSFLSAFFIYRFHKRWGNFLLIWACFIALSTITTRQHYVWDVIAGYILARVAFRVVEKVLLTRSEAVQ